MTAFDVSEERLALYLDYENLAIGARQAGLKFDMAPISDALAERGRLVVRRAYADWHLFSDDRASLVDHHVELIDIPQRSTHQRKNAADIKLAVDAMELALERSYVSTFVIGSGDSDFTPLVHKLRELDRRVIGIGIEGATSHLLPNSCDEFIFYDRLENVPGREARERRPAKGTPATATGPRTPSVDLAGLYRLVTQTLSGLQRSQSGPVTASALKRAILRKDPTFSESDYGFRAFVELLRHVESEGHIALGEGPAHGDPELVFPEKGGGDEDAFKTLVEVVRELTERNDAEPPLSGLKDHLRKRDPNFSEKAFGYSGFLQFCKAASARGLVELEWDDEDQEYYLRIPG